MGNIVQQVGLQLADSILAQLNVRSHPEATSKYNQNKHNRYMPEQSSMSSTSKIQVVHLRKVKGPPIFRCNASDTITLGEWVHEKLF